MDISNDVLSCRLCAVKLVEENLKHIFDETADLIQKISNILPITISPDDNHSKYICLDCYKKVTGYYDFVQNVLEYSKENVSMPKISSLFKHNRNKKIGTAAVSKLHSDMIYTCPNCNIDLMIIINSNSEGCDYAFQVALAVVDKMSKTMNDKNTRTSKNTADTDNAIMKKSNIKDEFNESCCIKDDPQNTNKICMNSPMLQENINCVDTHITSEKENTSHQANKCIKRKLQENVPLEISANPAKLQKLETNLEIPLRESNVDVLNCDNDCIDLIKIESINDNTDWFNNPIKHIENTNTVYVIKTEEERINEDCTKCKDIDIKGCPKIICHLCGTHFFSQLKYDFHMDRHKLNKMDKYICTVCDREASSENLLWDHYFHMHKCSMWYSCTECDKSFVKKSKLDNHQRRHKHSGIKKIQLETTTNDANIDHDTQKTIKISGGVSVSCNLCEKLITDLDPDAINDLVTCATCEDSTLSLMIDGNETKVISPRQYHCSKCPKHFVRKERLEFHEMRHNENMNEFICSTCSKEFSAENSLYEHYLFVHKGARPHICELCGKSFQLKARLKEHHRTHTGERPYQCDVCGQRCMTTNALKLHRKTHFSHNRYTCKICNKSFSKKQNMNEHLEKHWKNDKNVLLPQLFTCPVCLEDLPTYRMLKYHMMETHQIDRQDPLLTRQKPWYECDECHEKFKHQMSLKAHKEKIHEGKINPIFQCDICNATYRIKQLLINHIKSKHDGEKRYKCAQCRKGFNDTKSLYNHILLHTGKKPFICEYCNMSFRRKDSRDHHRRKHTGEQPYQCPDCNQSFSTYNNRSKHRKKEHGEGEIECPECGEKCSGQQEVRIHLNKHLGEKLNELQCT